MKQNLKYWWTLSNDTLGSKIVLVVEKLFKFTLQGWDHKIRSLVHISWSFGDSSFFYALSMYNYSLVSNIEWHSYYFQHFPLIWWDSRFIWIIFITLFCAFSFRPFSNYYYRWFIVYSCVHYNNSDHEQINSSN